MKRTFFALTALLATLAGSMLLVGTGYGDEPGGRCPYAPRLDVCPLMAADYFGCEYGVYAENHTCPASGTEVASDDASQSTTGCDKTGAENWDYFDDCYCWYEEGAYEAGGESAHDEPAHDEPAHDEHAADLAGIGHCLSEHDPQYDATVYGVRQCREAAEEVAEHVEVDLEYSFDEYQDAYGVEDPELARGAMFVAELVDEYADLYWYEDLYDFPQSESSGVNVAEQPSTAGDDDSDRAASWDDYADEYEAYEYDCHYGLNPWVACPRVDTQEAADIEESSEAVADAAELPAANVDESYDDHGYDYEYDEYDYDDDSYGHDDDSETSRNQAEMTESVPVEASPTNDWYEGEEACWHDVDGYSDDEANDQECSASQGDRFDPVIDDTATDEPVTAADEAATATDEAVTATDEAVTAVDEAVTVADEAVTAADEAVTVADESVTVADESVTVADESVTVADESVTAADESVTATVPAADEPVMAADEAVTAADEAVPAADEAVPAMDEAVTAMDEAVTAADEPVTAIDESASATDEPVTATDEFTATGTPDRHDDLYDYDDDYFYDEAYYGYTEELDEDAVGGESTQNQVEELKEASRHGDALPTAMDQLASSPLTRVAANLTGQAATAGMLAVHQVDWFGGCKSAIREARRFQRASIRAQMIEYYGLGDDEYGWEDPSGYYATYYATTIAESQPDVVWERMARGCGREMILDAAETLDQMGLALRSTSRRLLELTELK